MSKALLVVDIDKECGWVGKIDAQQSYKQPMASNFVTTLRCWRRGTYPVIFACYPFWKLSPPTWQIFAHKAAPERCISCDSDDPLAEFLGHRHGEQYEPVFLKDNIDAFRNLQLPAFLRSRGITEVVLAGCQTTCCVIATAKGAVIGGFSVTLLRDCVFPELTDKKEEELSWLAEVRAIADKTPVRVVSALSDLSAVMR